jgi:hypothetical protein
MELPARVDEVPRAFAAVAWWRSLHAQPLSKAATSLRYHVARERALVDGRVDVTQRLKRTSTIGDKLAREPTMDVTQMQDIGGVRARLPSVEHTYALSRRLKKPKSSGYRALHHIVRRDGRLIEVQLRTVLQDAWANQGEDDGHATGVGLKFGRGTDAANAYYALISQVFGSAEHGRDVPDALAQDLQTAHAKIKDSLPRQGR